VDVGRDFPFFGKIYPFVDAPDQAIRVLFFPLPLDSPYVPYPNPFVLRNWDRLDGEPQTPLGTDQFFHERYYGPLPTFPAGHVCGTADQWANGLHFTIYNAGGYACTCPEFTVPTYVSSINSPDNSLTIAPTTGAVLAILNTAHANNWTAQQQIDTPSTITPALTLHMRAGQAVYPFAVTDGAGMTRLAIEPPSSITDGCPIAGYRASNAVAFYLSSTELRLAGDDGGDSFGIALSDHAEATYGSVIFVALGGNTVFASTVRINPELTTSAGTTISCALSVENPLGLLVQSLRVTGFVSSAEKETFAVSALGDVLATELVRVGGTAGATVGQLTVETTDDRPGLVVRDGGGMSAGQLLVAARDAMNVPAFAIEKSGQIWTNQFAASTTPDPMVGQVAVYSQTGAYLGYVAVLKLAGPPPPVLWDTFTDVNGTLLTSHMMNTGPGWTQTGLPFEIQSNELVMTGNGYCACWSESGITDFTAQVTQSWLGNPALSDTLCGLLVRSAGGYSGYALHQRSAGTIELAKISAGPTYTALQTAAVTFTNGVPNVLKIVASANNLACYFDGVLVFTVVDSTFSGNTKHGLIGYHDASYASKWENFVVDV
jgi:hypothetical protein